MVKDEVLESNVRVLTGQVDVERVVVPPLNALLPIVVTLAPILTFESDELLVNALSPMVPVICISALVI